MAKNIDVIVNDAIDVVDALINKHKSAAIPAIIGACVQWAVMHGGTDVIKGSLRNAIKMADDMNRSVPRQ